MVSILRHVMVIHSMLEDGEVERFWIKANRLERKHLGALMITDRAVQWCGIGALSQTQDTWAFARIRGAEAVQTVEGPALRLTTPSDQIDFAAKAADVTKFLDALLPELSEPDAATLNAEFGLVDELERLSLLKATGVLSAEEFERAKRQLLN